MKIMALLTNDLAFNKIWLLKSQLLPTYMYKYPYKITCILKKISYFTQFTTQLTN